MEQEKRSFVHDTINLEEIRELLGFDPEGTETEILPIEEILQENPDQLTLLPEADESPEQLVFSMEEAGFPESEETAEEPTAEQEEPKQEETQPEEVPLAETSETEEPRKKSNWAYEFYGMLHDIIFLLAAVTLIFVYVVRLVGVQGESMMPTLHNKDYLLLESNFLYNGSDLEYGDIVVLNVPHFQDQGEGPIVKRIIATEGQTVDIDFARGQVYVDGVMLHETYINEPTYYNWEGQYGLQYPAVVPEGCVFVLGDNRNNSMDSRYAPIGMVDERYVLGKVILVAMPGQTKNAAGQITDPRQWGRIGLVD